MSLLVCWVAFPLLLGALALGWGLAVERASGAALPRALLVPVGLAAIVVGAGLLTASDATAEAATPVVAAAGGLGLLLGLRRLRPGWAAAAGVGAFAVFAAPIVLSGGATFAGYIKLDDTATFLAMTDRVLDHGRSLAGLPPSSYEAVLDVNLAHGYPVGSFLPLGIGSKLTAQDPAWLFQPYLAFLAGVLALAAYALLERVVPSTRVRALAAFVAAQPALLYAYSLWGGIKELAAAALLAVAAAAAAAAPARGARAALPAAIAAAAVLDVLSPAGAVWLVPLLVAAIALRGARVAGMGVAGAAVLGAPALVTIGDFLRGANTESFTSGSELGNLVRPLSFLQALGIWPTGDFRFTPPRTGQTYVLVAVVMACALAGLTWALRRRAWSLVAYTASALVGAAVFDGAGSPWVGAKALAVSSPAFVAAAGAGVAWVFSSGRRVEASALAAAIAGGVLWSNALAYHDTTLAPRGQLRELEQIGERFAGDGPALMTDYQVYGARHFLRRLDPEGASELRRRLVPLANGQILQKGASADIDQLRLDGVLVYRTLVLRRGPAGSRPPSLYRRVWHGRWYDVWQRPAHGGRAILEHLALGDAGQAGAVPPCNEVLRLAKRGTLATVERGAEIEAAADGSFVVPRRARYEIWIAGSFRGQATVRLDGRRLASDRDELNWTGLSTSFGSADLSPGRHRIEVHVSGPDWRPGTGGTGYGVGGATLSPDDPDRPVELVPPSQARSLCGKRLDWIEALAPQP